MGNGANYQFFHLVPKNEANYRKMQLTSFFTSKISNLGWEDIFQKAKMFDMAKIGTKA